MAFAYAMRQPKDWQQFERSTHVLARCVMDDPNAQMHGRGGQAQAGVDIWGTRKSSGKRVGVQCKLKLGEGVTKHELAAEVAKALTFQPPIDEFVLVTTAPRDAAIQQVARQTTAAMAGTARPVVVVVWGWQDVEEQAEPHPEAQKAFDPTYSPYVENVGETLLEAAATLSGKIDSLSPPQQVHNPRDEKLFRDFEQLIGANRIDWLTTHDFGSPVETVLLDPFLEFDAVWRGPNYEFIDVDLQESFKAVQNAGRAFADRANWDLNWMGSSTTVKSVKDLADERSGDRSPATKARADGLNAAATKLSGAINAFVRLARRTIAA